MIPKTCPFASKSVTEHVARGFGGAALVGVMLWLIATPSAWHVAGALAATAGAVMLLRGCPTCWLVGLFATLGARSEARRTSVTDAAGAKLQRPDPAAT